MAETVTGTGPLLLAGRYEVGELLGRGGMAEVHAGWDTRLGREIAIKMLRSDLARDSSFILRFRREAQAAAGLNHPAIVAVYDSGEATVIESGGAELGVPFIVMEHVHGRTLREILHQDGAMSPDQAARVMAQALGGLQYSHEHGIVHRDIKPANVMLSETGEVKVMDFGIARAVADTAATMTNTSVVIGTAQYLSPEQAQGQGVDARSDVYSASCLLYELLTGRTPFVGDSPLAIAYQHVGEKPAPPSRHRTDIPPTLDAVVMLGLTKDREARYQTAAHLAADLEAVRHGAPVSAPAQAILRDLAEATATANADGEGVAPGSPPTPGAHDAATGAFPAVPLRRRRRWPWALTVFVLAAGVAGGLWLFSAGLIGGPRESPVPNVVNLSETAASAELSKAGFTSVVTLVPDKAAQGTVLSQAPAASALLRPQALVTLTVSAGPRSVTIPDLKNFDQASARQRLNDLNLTVSAITQTDSNEVAAGNVVSTTPKARTTVQEGTTVVLVLSTGRIQVPKVVGMKEADALSALNQVGLQVKITYVDSARTVGTVIKQSFAGTRVVVGSVINVQVVRRRPQTRTTTVTTTQTLTPNPTPSISSPGSTTAPPP